jgi:hypothetical protein
MANERRNIADGSEKLRRHGGKLDLVATTEGCEPSRDAKVVVDRGDRQGPQHPAAVRAVRTRCNVTPMPELTLLPMLREQTGLAARRHLTGFTG